MRSSANEVRRVAGWPGAALVPAPALLTGLGSLGCDYWPAWYWPSYDYSWGGVCWPGYSTVPDVYSYQQSVYDVANNAWDEYIRE